MIDLAGLSPLSMKSGPVLFWVPGGMPLMLHVEGALALALKLRGIAVHAIICDGPFQACVRRELSNQTPVDQWSASCGMCKRDSSAVLKSLGIPHSYIGDYVSAVQTAGFRKQVEALTPSTLRGLSYQGVEISQNVRSAFLRFLKGSDPSVQEAVFREYAFSGLVTAAAAAQAFDELRPRQVFMSHGIYVDWGPALHTALARNIPVTAWMASYLNACFIFRHVSDGIRLDFHNLSPEAWEACSQLHLSAAQDSRLDGFLENRYKRRISFDMKELKPYSGDSARLRRKYAPDASKPVWGVMAHINWDSVTDYSPMAYATFDEWMLDTLHEIVRRPEVHWLVKVHPAEAWDNPLSGVQRLIQQHFPVLPPHVQVLPAEEEVSPLDFFQLLDGGVTVYGTAGLELALMGKPVILAGDAHYGGKGFTFDGLTPKSYKQLLRDACNFGPLSSTQTTLARKYAYCYFLQRQLPLLVVKDPNSRWWNLRVEKLNLLEPGKDRFVDFICDRILDGKDFIMDDSLVAASLGETPEQSAQTPVSSTQLQLEAFEKFEAGDWPGALSKFERVLQLQPGRQGFHFMRARCHAAMGQSALATEAAEAELRIQPNHPDALQILIRLKESEGTPLSTMAATDALVSTTKTLATQPHAPRFKIRVPLVNLPGGSVIVPQDSQRQVLQSSRTNGHSLKDASDWSAMNRPAGIATSNRALSKLLGFDSSGEVFTDGQRILRGIFPGKAAQARKALAAYQRRDLNSRGVVRTIDVSDQWRQLGYDLVLEHEKIPFITYSHEWPAEMLKQAALLQIDLASELDRHGFVLKDSGASGNVLFRGPEPVFVDFLSILAKEDLEQQEWLKPREASSAFQPLWSARSAAFHEIHRRMFYPYLLYPLYMQHQARHAEARQRMLETTLNTCFDAIKESEVFVQAKPEQFRLHALASAARELALVRDDWQKFLDVLRGEVEGLKVAPESSDYSNYYELKNEAFGFEPCPEWLPKQRGVYEALKRSIPSTVLDIGANTGWFSMLAAKQNCQVVAMDNDEASMNLLFRRARQEALPILPLVMDFCKPTADVAPFSGYEKDQHSRNSRIPGEVPLLLAMEKRLKCDLVLALAIVHHLTLGKGLSLESVVTQLAGLAKKQLVMEFVPKEDELVLREPQFFPAYSSNPGSFSWYTEENWLKALGRHFPSIEKKESVQGRKLLICSR
jgi:SAM-dependent methyltransferase